MKLTSLLILIATIAGCASRGEIETMKRQLDYLERSSTQMQDRIVKLDSLYRQTIDKNVSYQADLKVALSDLIEKSNSIDGRMTDMEQQLQEIRKHLDSPGSRQVATVPQKPDMTSNDSSTSQQATVDPKKVFDNAFTDLRAGNYDLAILQFNEYLSSFKDGAQTDEAQYWLGECFYGKKEYGKAIPEFEKVEKNYPNSQKLVPALYKLGRSYEETGNCKQAKKTFERIVKDYAGSFEAKPAQDKLKELPCR